jgi:hypothetical protein
VSYPRSSIIADPDRGVRPGQRRVPGIFRHWIGRLWRLFWITAGISFLESSVTQFSVLNLNNPLLEWLFLVKWKYLLISQEPRRDCEVRWCCEFLNLSMAISLNILHRSRYQDMFRWIRNLDRFLIKTLEICFYIDNLNKVREIAPLTSKDQNSEPTRLSIWRIEWLVSLIQKTVS